MTIDESLRLLSYACAPILTIAALYGLKQLSVSRAIAKMQAKRDSFRLAAEQCRYYLEEIIPLQDIQDAKSEEYRKALDAASEVSVTSSGYSVSFIEKPPLDRFRMLASDFIDVFNRMEGFAAFFTSGVAEEKVAFNSVGRTYCSHVRSYLPDLAIAGAGEDCYMSVIKLFITWNSRLEEIRLRKERAAVEEQILAHKVLNIKAIGT